jgi:predicted transcriptional regulator
MEKLMKKKYGSWILLLMLLLVMAEGAAAVETGGYVVQPGYGIYPDYSDLYFTTHSADTVLLNDPAPTPIRFADLPPAVLILLGIAVVTSGIIYLGKYLAAANLPLVGGFKRVTKKNLLESRSRDAIFQCVKEQPGAHLHDLKKATGFTYKNLIYHLKMLTSFGVVTSAECKNTVGYFENSGRLTRDERAILQHLRHPRERKILETIAQHPGISRKEISGLVGISGPSVSWHMAGLLNDRIIEQKKEGTIVRHYLPDAMRELYETRVGLDS